MEKKSNNDQYEDKSYIAYTGGEEKNLFRVPDATANVILKFCDDRTLLNLLTVSKAWNQKINGLKLDKRKEYLKYFLWYVYGCGNAERLCKIIDDVVNKLDYNQGNIIKENEDNNEDKKFLLWFMVLLDILNIKMADLKLDFSKKKSESIEKAIKNHLLSDESVERSSNFIGTENLFGISLFFGVVLWNYVRKIFYEFQEIGGDSSNQKNKVDTCVYKLLNKIFACFFKVSFYQMKKASDKKWHEKIIKFRDYFHQNILCKNSVCELWNYWKYLATYLFKTGELEQYFLGDEDENDFLDYFCIFFNRTYFKDALYNFDEFCFYLNKMKPLETRYQEDNTRGHEKFWQMFFPEAIQKHKLTDPCFVAITAYFSDAKLIKSIEAYINDKKILIDDFSRSILFKKDRQKVIPDGEQKNYFNSIIIRFCRKKDLTDKVVQSISKVIKSKDGVDHEDEVKINVLSNSVQNNQIVSNEINFVDGDQISNANNKSDKKNKAGVWSHLLFGLFLVLACLSLFLCFKISFLYFILPFVIFSVVASYFGFKNYFRGCCCTSKIETPAIYQCRNSLVKVNSNEQPQTFVNDELKIQ